MYKYEEGLANISKLKPCPVKVTLQTEKMLKDLTVIAKTNPDTIEPITVAILGSEQYIANGDLRVKAFENAGKDSLKAWFVTVKSIGEIIKLHIDLNTHGSINPLKMIDAISYLEKHHLSHLIDKQKIEMGRIKLYPKVRQKLDEFLSISCTKYSTVDLPFYVISKILEFSTEEEQLVATTVILDSADGVKNNQLAFPTPASLKGIFSALIPNNDKKEVTIYEPKDNDHPDWKKPDRKHAEELIRGTSGDSFVSCQCGRELVLNGKTRKVSIVHDDYKNKIRKLEDGEGHPVYAIPPKYLRFLESEEGQSLRILKIDGPKDLEKFAKSLKQNTSFKMIVITVP